MSKKAKRKLSKTNNPERWYHRWSRHLDPNRFTEVTFAWDLSRVRPRGNSMLNATETRRIERDMARHARDGARFWMDEAEMFQQEYSQPFAGPSPTGRTTRYRAFELPMEEVIGVEIRPLDPGQYAIAMQTALRLQEEMMRRLYEVTLIPRGAMASNEARPFFHPDLVREIKEQERTAQARSIALLKANLTKEQLEQYENLCSFDVIGQCTGHRYRINIGSVFNVWRLNSELEVERKYCFGPVDSLPVGDMLLAQKVALETYELETLALANFTPVSQQTGGLLGADFGEAERRIAAAYQRDRSRYINDGN